jgi:hypothetical protein
MAGSAYTQQRHLPARPKRPNPRLDKPNVPPPAAFIQAYEAQLVYGQRGLADEIASKDGKGGKGLIRWQGDGEGETVVWADR